jgi:hypothetical protein
MATTEAKNKELARKLPEEAINEANLDVIDEIVVDDYVSRLPTFNQSVIGPSKLVS